MKHVSLGGLDVSRIGLGAMTMAGVYTSGGGGRVLRVARRDRHAPRRARSA